MTFCSRAGRVTVPHGHGPELPIITRPAHAREATALVLITRAPDAYLITSTTEGVARLDFFDPSSSRADNRLTAHELDFLLRANFYLLDNQLKLQANAVAKTFGDEGPDSRLTLLFNFQVAW